MGSILKRVMHHFNGTGWDDYYPQTSSDQVVHTKSNGTETTVEKELLDIEYGTWTPVVTGFSSTGTLLGTYMKIGNMVVVNFFINGVCNNTDANLMITGLPFEASKECLWYAGGGHCQGASFGTADATFNGWALQTSNNMIYGRGSKVATTSPYTITGDSTTYAKSLGTSNVNASGTIMYKIAE